MEKSTEVPQLKKRLVASIDQDLSTWIRMRAAQTGRSISDLVTDALVALRHDVAVDEDPAPLLSPRRGSERKVRAAAVHPPSTNDAAAPSGHKNTAQRIAEQRQEWKTIEEFEQEHMQPLAGVLKDNPCSHPTPKLVSLGGGRFRCRACNQVIRA